MILVGKEEIIVVSDEIIEILSVFFSNKVRNLNIPEYWNSDTLYTE